MNVLVEAVGSPAWPTLLPYLRAAVGRIVALEIDPLAVGASLVDHCIMVPPYGELRSVDRFLSVCEEHRIDVVLPSVNEGLHLWAREAPRFAERGTRVVISPPETIATFQDKWETYRFFREHGIPTPATSLRHEHELLKPRIGRGGAGSVCAPPDPRTHLEGYVSQRLVRGREISVDALCGRDGRPVYLVQRERLAVESGLCVRGRVVDEPAVETWARRVLDAAHFVGIVNLQCFVEGGDVLFIEVNPRIPGGLSLSMRATENWIAALLKLLDGEPIEPVPVRVGTTMLRHWSDVFLDAESAGATAATAPPEAPCRANRSASSS